MINTTEIHSTLNKMLNDPKTKPFLNHLIRSYYPTNKIQQVVDRPAKIYKCVITKEDLLCITDITDAPVREDFKTNFQKYLKLVITDPTISIAVLPNNKSMGITGTETTTYMSMPIYSVFTTWINQKLKEKDKHISWLISSIKYEEKLRDEKNKQTTFTLGELDAFKKIKLKF